MKNLPSIPTTRIAIKVKPKVESIIRKGHPWIFDEGITKQSDAGKAGDLAIIYDNKKNKLLAIGLYDPHSPIRIKVLHTGKPASIDAGFFRKKIEAAYQIRQPLLQTDTNSYRLLYGENDGLPSLIADVYAEVLVVKLYSGIWLPYLDLILPILLEMSQCKTLVLRLNRLLQKMPEQLHGLYDGQILFGALEQEDVIFKEHGLSFSANVVQGHKTGYFLDHRHNRKKIGSLAKDKKVLDVFAYAGGFSVHALAGGAKEVTSLDISQQALKMAQQNVALNLPNATHHTLAIDAFEGLTQLKREGKRYDIVVVDPPSFAKRDSEREKAVFQYQQLAKLAIPLVQKNGILLLASCSSRVRADAFFEAVLSIIEKSGRRFQELERTFHDTDHPIGFPEGAYLKAIYFKMLA